VAELTSVGNQGRYGRPARPKRLIGRCWPKLEAARRCPPPCRWPWSEPASFPYRREAQTSKNWRIRLYVLMEVRLRPARSHLRPTVAATPHKRGIGPRCYPYPYPYPYP